MTESLFCYSCGFESFENLANVDNSSSPTMHRASFSRQADHRHGGMGRVRSEERLLSLAGEEELKMRDQEVKVQDKREEETGLKNLTMDDGDGIVADVDAGKADTALIESDVPPPKKRIHRRAMSDPFDTPISDVAMDEIRKLEEEALKEIEHQHTATETAAIKEQPKATHHHVPAKPAYPTLPRYPVAATRDKNCWNEPPISIFSVRGANYLKDKTKVPSKDYLFRARGCDLFLFDEGFDVSARNTQILNGQLRSLPTLAINFQFPWGSIILYFEIPDKLAKYVRDESWVPIDPGLSVGEKVMANWIQGDTDYKNDRLKLISYVAEGPWVVRNMVTGRPAIIGKKLPASYMTIPADPASHEAALLQCTLDIGSSSTTAKRIVSVCRRYMSALTVDIGFVIQGDTRHELPEQMLGACRIHGPDPLKAPKLS